MERHQRVDLDRFYNLKNSGQALEGLSLVLVPGICFEHNPEYCNRPFDEKLSFRSIL